MEGKKINDLMKLRFQIKSSKALLSLSSSGWLGIYGGSGISITGFSIIALTSEQVHENLTKDSF